MGRELDGVEFASRTYRESPVTTMPTTPFVVDRGIPVGRSMREGGRRRPRTHHRDLRRRSRTRAMDGEGPAQIWCSSIVPKWGELLGS